MFPSAPIVGFHNGKSLKDHLIRASLPILVNTLSSEPCRKRNCQVCQFIVNVDTFSPITTEGTVQINKGPLNCNSKKIVYLSECKKCKNLYVGKAQTKFCMRLNLFCFLFVLFWDISLNAYIIEAVRFCDLPIILVNLWET